jgi:hypothetical protein
MDGGRIISGHGVRRARLKSVSVRFGEAAVDRRGWLDINGQIDEAAGALGAAPLLQMLEMLQRIPGSRKCG